MISLFLRVQGFTWILCIFVWDRDLPGSFKTDQDRSMQSADMEIALFSWTPTCLQCQLREISTPWFSGCTWSETFCKASRRGLEVQALQP